MVGIGFDMHKLAEGETLILGGVKLDSKIGTVAHSDGDVVLHSIIDALLGAAGLGDIGDHFPDTDQKYKNADSSLLTKEVVGMIDKKGMYIVNIDCTIVLEKPKLSAHKNSIKEKVAEICGIKSDQVNIKATTNEKTGFIGRGEGIVVHSVCELQKSE